jgi:ammonia channel protein AmtB
MRAALAGVGAFAVAYLLPGTLQLPVLIYDPVAHATHFGRVENAVQMRYYGDLIVASVAGIAAAAIALKLPPRKTPMPIAAATALSLVALDVLFYLSRLLAAM